MPKLCEVRIIGRDVGIAQVILFAGSTLRSVSLCD